MFALLCAQQAPGVPNEPPARKGALAGVTSPPNPAASAADIPATRSVAFSFKDLGLAKPIELQGIDGSDTLGFGLRRDEVVTAATLRLHYNFSPSLLPDLSHLKIYLNEEVVATVPLPKEQAGSEQHRDIALDPRYFSDFNQLRLQLIGHYTLECEDALHSSLWASISARSELALDLRTLALPDDLALLPAPFFDLRDNRTLDLPFVFARVPSVEALHAAGVLASWFGALADYRRARFPVSLDELPRRHALVFAPNDALPRDLHLSPAESPGLTIMPHPDDNRIKLLVLTGRDSGDLVTAARALVLAEPGLSGHHAAITSVMLPVPREAYDAPRWLASDRPTKLGEIVRSPEDLQVKTRVPRLIGLRVRLPPDLLVWQSEGVPVELHYRYTPPVADDMSSLNVGVNNEFLYSLPLPARGLSEQTGSIKLPLRDDSQPFDTASIKLPAFQAHADNHLQFQFTFDYHKQGLCRSFQLDNVRAAIDPDSTIDISGFAHYAEMPNLAAFAHLGFPFTKYADLAETSVVLPDQTTPTDIEALLSILGHFGRATGLPALRFRLAVESDIAATAGTDLMLIDTAGHSAVLARWREQLPATITSGSRTIGQRFQTWPAYLLEDPDTPDAGRSISRATAQTDGPLAAFLGFESPLTPGRSVVALTANSRAATDSALTALADPGRASSIRGDIAYIRGDQVESFQIGDPYFVGHLPFWTWTWFHVSRHPLWLALVGVVAGFGLALTTYAGLKRVARKRLQE